MGEVGHLGDALPMQLIDRLVFVVSLPAIRDECSYLFGRSTTHGFLIKAIGSYGIPTSFAITTFNLLEMFLHVLES